LRAADGSFLPGACGKRCKIQIAVKEKRWGFGKLESRTLEECDCDIECGAFILIA